MLVSEYFKQLKEGRDEESIKESIGGFIMGMIQVVSMAILYLISKFYG